MKQKTCSFTGHRQLPAEKLNKIKRQTLSAIEELIKKGVTNFICGGALGYDTLCAQAVLFLKTRYEGIRLTIAIPCEGQSRYFSNNEKKLYDEILDRADERVYVSREYFAGCMHKRNRYMVDNSAYLIAYCTRTSGGSYYTKEYAKRNNVTVIEITAG
ncbi:MAG: DUF1273 family protein [Clostridia bacterium]|nr:DUF1273 family protein [Clostridia bacterium]